MIGRSELNEKVQEWGLREDIVEKDYVIGWVLWGLGSDPTLSVRWVFKGGTCLKKCYIETYRFSEDLDFTVMPGGPIQPEEVHPILERVLARVGTESGINFTVQPLRIRSRPSGRSTEVRIYYQGPRQALTPASIKFDLSGDEQVIRPTELREIAHPYSDGLPPHSRIRCYSFDELFAEKIRAMGERSRPRDLYDIINLFRRQDLLKHPGLIQTALLEKCEAKGVAIPTFEAIEASPHRTELEAEWNNMLSHQLPTLPPFAQFWEELPTLFLWLGGIEVPEELSAYPASAEEIEGWEPPPTIWSWGAGSRLESVRFAGANHLLVELRYDGRTRLIEPYSLRQTKDGNRLLHAIRLNPREHRSYRVDRIQGVRVTTTPFKPIYAIEFASSGPIRVLPSTITAAPRNRRGKVYIIECLRCGKRFTRSRLNTIMRPHKDKNGWNCLGRSGTLVDTRFD